MLVSACCASADAWCRSAVDLTTRIASTSTTGFSFEVGGAHFRHHDVGQTRRIRGRIDRTDQGRHKKSKRNLSRGWESVVERRLGENCAWVSRTGGEVGEGPHLVRGEPTMFEVGVLKKCGQCGAALRFSFSVCALED